MENQDSEPLFGDDVYMLLRDDSLLQRTGSNNFASLIDCTDPVIPNDTSTQQQLGQQQQQQQQGEGYQEQQPKPEHQQQVKPELQQQVKPELQQQVKQELQQQQNEQQVQKRQEIKEERTNQNDHQNPQQCIIYNQPFGTTHGVVLVSNNNAVADLNCPTVTHGGQQQIQLQQAQLQPQQQQQQQQQQIEVSWNEIDMEDELAQSSNSGVPIISTSTFMAIMEESSSSLMPDSTSRTVPSLQPWAGKYNFAISVPTDNKDRNKWCYNKDLKKLYVCPNVAVPVSVKMSKWIDASITITPVFQQSQHRMEPVSRCYNCKNIKNCDAELGDYVVQVEGEGCEYEIILERHVVKVPLQHPPPGEVASTLLVKLMCLTSCVGGPNRRPFCLVLTLRCSITGVEIGRQILDVKCCKCPSRDMTNDAKGSTPNANNNTQTTDDGKLTKIRKLSSQIQVDQRRKRTKIKPEPGSESRYVNVAVPVEFELQVKSYVNGLIAEQILRRNHPNLLLYPDDDN